MAWNQRKTSRFEKTV